MNSSFALLPNYALNAIFYVFSFVLVASIATISQQIFFKSAHRPPVVFHWLPIIGSTITYGIDPIKFFFDCQAKVREKNKMV